MAEIAEKYEFVWDNGTVLHNDGFYWEEKDNLVRYPKNGNYVKWTVQNGQLEKKFGYHSKGEGIRFPSPQPHLVRGDYTIILTFLPTKIGLDEKKNQKN